MYKYTLKLVLVKHVRLRYSLENLNQWDILIHSFKKREITGIIVGIYFYLWMCTGKAEIIYQNIHWIAKLFGGFMVVSRWDLLKINVSSLYI